jgi:hypothetical protein
MIFDLDHEPTGLDTGRQLIMLAHEGEGRIVLDPAQHVRYTWLDHEVSSRGPGPGV